MSKDNRRISELEAALTLALNYLEKAEPGDSRAGSNEFVAMYSVCCGDSSGSVMPIIRAALAEQANG